MGDYRGLIELLSEEGPGDNLVDHLRQHPDDYTPKFLEIYRRGRDQIDELIAKRTKADVQAEVERLEQSIAFNDKSCPDSKAYIKSLNAALTTTKEMLEQFDDDPVRLHAVARYRARQKQRTQE